MELKKIITLVLAFLILISVGLYFVFFRSNKKSAPENQNTEVKTINVEDKKITDSTNPFKIDITYPEIAGYDNFNSLVKNIIDTQISDFKKNSLENDSAVKETDPENYAKYPREYDLIIKYDRGQVNKDIASVVFDIYNFEGGAHGASYQIALNYDLKNKKEVTLADVFAGQENYLQKISEFCITDLTKQIIALIGNTDGLWIKDGASPVAENFKTFLINGNNITFYFPQYQVAYGALGGFKVIMPKQ
jgi:hypothetical protein